MQDIKTIVNHLYEQAKKNLKKKGKLEPKLYFVILYPDQTTAVYFPVPVSGFFEDERIKKFIPEYVKMAWNKKKMEGPPGIELKAVCLISDAYISQYSALTTTEEQLKNKPRPSKDPDRQEAVMINICEKVDKYGFWGIYKRHGGKIVFNDIQEAALDSPGQLTGGWGAELFPE